MAECSTPACYPRGPGFSTWPGDPMAEKFFSSTQRFQANAGGVPQIRPQLLPSTSFPIHYS